MNRAPKSSRGIIVAVVILLLIGAVMTWQRSRTPAPTEVHAMSLTAGVEAVLPAPDPPIASPKTQDDASAVWRGPKKREGVDAANIYANAFVLFDQLTDEEKAMIRKPGEEVDAEKAAQRFEKIQAIMALLRDAAKADYCDWGTSEIDFATGLPHISKAGHLGMLALLAAAYRFSADPSGAIDDLSAGARLAHHLTDTLLGAKVAATLERSANDLIHYRMSTLDDAATTKALQFLASSTMDADLTRAFRGELSMVESCGTKLASMDPLERSRMLLAVAGGESKSADWLDPVKEFAAGLFFSPQRIADEVAFIRGIYERAADAMRLPEAEFQNWWKGVQNDAKDGHPLARMALSRIGSLQSSIQRLRVERTLLKAGADILQNGPAQLGQYRDPATGSPLQYVATATGFELRSPYQPEGKPLAMSFARPQRTPKE